MEVVLRVERKRQGWEAREVGGMKREVMELGGGERVPEWRSTATGVGFSCRPKRVASGRVSCAVQVASSLRRVALLRGARRGVWPSLPTRCS